MTLLDLITSYSGGAYHKAGIRYAGPCPKCGGKPGTNRFVTKVGSETGKCFSCGWGCDLVGYLREIQGLSCRDAFARIGRDCERTDCPSFDKCHGTPARRKNYAAPVTAPRQRRAEIAPAAPRTPAEMWQHEAQALADRAYAAILGNKPALDYLAGRGLDLAAVQKYRLGWLAGENGKTCIFRPRTAWGLEPKQRDDGSLSTILWIPRGITIPTIINGRVERLRIRRPNGDLGPKDAKYIAVEGGGSHVPSLNPDARAQIAIESDLDALLVDHLAGDIIGAIPLTTVGVMPNGISEQACQQAAVILVALDFDTPQLNERTGRMETPGANAWQRWSSRYSQAERWPVPEGKDPGEAWAAGVDLRQWVIDGLPISLHPKQARVLPVPDPEPAPTSSQYITATGRTMTVAYDRETFLALAATGVGAFTPKELEMVTDADVPTEVDEMLLDIKETFPGAWLKQI